MAREGADIIAVDICSQIDSVPYPMATPDDLMSTASEVETLGRRVVARQADAGDQAQLDHAVRAGIAELGGLDVVVVNHGIWTR